MRRLSLALLLLFAATAVSAQLPRLTWVRQFSSEMRNEEFLRAIREPLDRLHAEKKITGWGLLTPMTRTGEPWTHAVYITAADWGSFEAVGAAFEASPLFRSGTRDNVLRHVIQSETAPKNKPRFAVVNYHPVARGRDSDAHALFNEWAKPVFQTLGEKGVVGPWSLAVQDTVVDNKWTYIVTYFISDLSALDDVNAELMKMGAPRLGTFERRLREMSEDDYVGQILRVVHSAP